MSDGTPIGRGKIRTTKTVTWTLEDVMATDADAAIANLLNALHDGALISSWSKRESGDEGDFVYVIRKEATDER